LHKDQIMLDLQLLLANLHDWVAQSYFDPSWHNLSLEKATQMVYRKAGRVTWHSDRIEVMLEPYRYSDHSTGLGCAGVMAVYFAFRSLRPESSSYAVIKVLVKPNANSPKN
jgi:hypothetical protein